jgi:hypothetical protein
MVLPRPSICRMGTAAKLTSQCIGYAARDDGRSPLGSIDLRDTGVMEVSAGQSLWLTPHNRAAWSQHERATNSHARHHVAAEIIERRNRSRHSDLFDLVVDGESSWPVAIPLGQRIDRYQTIFSAN